MKKYETHKYDCKITEVEVVRETDKSVVIVEPLNAWRKTPRERLARKDSEFNKYHDTWELAHAFLLDRATRSLENARLRLATAQGEHGNVKGMRNPNVTTTKDSP